VIVLDRIKQLFELGEFVVVGGEERLGVAVLMDEFDDGPGDGETVVGGGAAADLVEEDERARGCGIENGGVSVISTMKVERPRARLSEAPMRVKMRSTVARRRGWRERRSPSAPSAR